MTSTMREQIALLGKRKSLFGIMTPAAGTAPADQPTIVILNAGIIHRVGPNRMFVTLARRLAALGYTVVRFDLSGIGDSEPRPDSLNPLDAALADITEVLDSLEAMRPGAQFIVIGLCSGADQAIVLGSRDARVAGAVIIDPAIPRTWRYWVNHYRGRVFRLSSWLNFWRGHHVIWKKIRRAVQGDAGPRVTDSTDDLQTPQVRAYLGEVYARAVARQLDLLAVLTGDRQLQHNYREQLYDAFPKVVFGKRVRLEYIESTDHTFTTERDRETLLRMIVEWIASRSAGVSSATAGPGRSAIGVG